MPFRACASDDSSSACPGGGGGGPKSARIAERSPLRSEALIRRARESHSAGTVETRARERWIGRTPAPGRGEGRGGEGHLLFPGSRFGLHPAGLLAAAAPQHPQEGRVAPRFRPLRVVWLYWALTGGRDASWRGFHAVAAESSVAGLSI